MTCPLNRVDVIGTPLAPDIFSICDEIMKRDSRIAELWEADPNGCNHNDDATLPT